MRAESGLRQQVDAVFARAGVTRRIAFELSTSDAVVRFVALGFGPALIPRSAGHYPA
jgi:DNA-binding transcriptional LysR family regulator